MTETHPQYDLDPVAFIYSDELLRYHFHDDHPFHAHRLRLTMDLIKKCGLTPERFYTPFLATDHDLFRVHDPHFIKAVQEASLFQDRHDPRHLITCRSDDDSPYGIGTEDTPLFHGMDHAARSVVGATLLGAQLVASGQVKHAINLAGGLHHAAKARASGFCVYNDAAVAIAYLREVYQMKVAYIDTDAHHGDGVQSIFYDDPNVLTISIHETGKYLYPGTGFIEERGAGAGYGYSFNMPLEAFTEDQSFLDTLHTCIPPLLHRFKPDLIITQNGCDAHTWDPLTHLCATTRIYQEIPKLIHQLAHEICDGRLVTIGGGGYDIWRVVPRAWTMLWSEISGYPLPEKVPQEWIQTWQPMSPVELPTDWVDPESLFVPVPRRQEIEERNAINARKAIHGTPFLL